MVGHAKNERFELIFGNLLIGFGGLLSGLAFTDLVNWYFFVIATPIFALGIIFDVRVLKKFAFDLSKIQDSITKTMNVVSENMADIQKTKQEMEKIHRETFETKKEITNTQRHLNSTMNNLEKQRKELEKLDGDIYPKNTRTDPNLLIRRFENIENFTMFDIDKQPILLIYKKLIFNKPQNNLKSTQDFKLVKLLSLMYKLVWYNNSLLYYKDSKIYFYPLINLMNDKNRLNQLCRLKIYEYSGEINQELEEKMNNVVASCYNSMIDSQDLSNFGLEEPDMIVKEHFVSVSKVNEEFKKLFFEVNDFLTIKFSNKECERISNLSYSI